MRRGLTQGAERLGHTIGLALCDHTSGAVLPTLCRVSKRHVVISLPNPHRDFYAMLREGNYCEGRHLKFYGLPPEPPEDRHRWFFTVEEPQAFLEPRAQPHEMEILEPYPTPAAPRRLGLRGASP